MANVVMSDSEDRYWDIDLGYSRVDVRVPKYDNNFPMALVVQPERR